MPTRRITPIFVLASLLAGLLVTLPIRAAEGPIVAMFDMEDKGSGLTPEVLTNLVDYLAARMTECGYRIIPRNEIRKRIREQQKESYKECYDESCQVELGRELAAQKTLSTRVMRIADTCQVTGVLYDLKQATTDRAATVEARCDERKLLDATKEMAHKLCLVLNPEAVPPAALEVEEEPEPPSPPMHPMTLWGHVGFWTGVGILGGGVTMMIFGKKAADDFDRLGDWSKRDDSKRYTGLGLGGLGLGAALVATGTTLWVLSPGPQWPEGEGPPEGEDPPAGDGPSVEAASLAPLPGGGWTFGLGGRW